MLPGYIAQPALTAGTLEVVLPKFAPQENWFKAYIPKRKMGTARVKALVGHLQAYWAGDEETAS